MVLSHAYKWLLIFYHFYNAIQFFLLLLTFQFAIEIKHILHTSTIFKSIDSCKSLPHFQNSWNSTLSFVFLQRFSNLSINLPSIQADIMAYQIIYKNKANASEYLSKSAQFNVILFMSIAVEPLSIYLSIYLSRSVSNISFNTYLSTFFLFNFNLFVSLNLFNACQFPFRSQPQSYPFNIFVRLLLHMSVVLIYLSIYLSLYISVTSL